MSRHTRCTVPRFVQAVGAAVVICLLAGSLPASTASPIVLVVHPESLIEDLAPETATKVFKGKLTTLGDLEVAGAAAGHDARVRLFIEKSIEEELFRGLLDMTPRRFRRRWVAALLPGKQAVGPKLIEGNTKLLSRVRADPAAIGVCRLHERSEAIRIVTLGGKGPEDASYPLR